MPVCIAALMFHVLLGGMSESEPCQCALGELVDMGDVEAHPQQVPLLWELHDQLRHFENEQVVPLSGLLHMLEPPARL